MLKRVVGILVIGKLALHLAMVQASPIGFYGRLSGMIYWGQNSTKKDNLAPLLQLVWQPTRTHVLDFGWTMPFTTMKGTDGENVRNALTCIWKNVIPLKYYLNVYGQLGTSWKSKLGLHAPFFGVGGSYHYNRRWHVDIAWRHYGLLRELKKEGSPTSRQNCIVMGIGFYVR